MKKIMIIGAGILQLPVIRKAKELGHTVICVDMDPNAIGFKEAHEYEVINIVDKEQCYEYAKRKGIDGVLTVATDYGVLTSSYISKLLGLKGLSYDVCKVIKNKYKVREVFKENNISDIYQYFEVSNINECNRIKESIRFPVIVKPVDGSGSRGVSIVRKKEDIENGVKEALKISLSKKSIIETFIDGNEYGVEIFVYNNDIHILSIMEKIMTKAPIFAELGHSVVIDEEILSYRISEVVKKAIKALNINFGSVNMDLLVNDDKVVIIDIGARAGGNLISSHIVPLSTEIDLYRNIIMASLGEDIYFNKSKNIKAIATRILNFKEGIISKINYHEIEKIRELEYVKDIILNISVGDKVREYKNNLDSCGYVVVEGSSKEDAKEKALYIRNKIEKLVKII